MADFADNSVPPDRADGDGTESADDLASRSQVDSIERESSTWAHVRRYHDLGWAMFPVHAYEGDDGCSCGNKSCGTPGKHPVGHLAPNGVKDATNDLDTLRRWFADGSPWNVAVACGAKSGITVVDIDPRHEGDAALRKWVATTGVMMPKTLRALTGGGGTHLVFDYVPDVRNRNGFLKGVDLKNNDGYVVVAPSSHASGGVYEWEDLNVPPAQMPSALVDMARRSSGRDGNGERLPDASRILAGIAEGQRDDTLFRWACQLRRYLNDDRELIELLIAEAARSCEPPFPYDQAMKKVDQAFLQDHTDNGEAIGPDGYRQSDGGNAVRFARRFGTEVLYVVGPGWHGWDGSVWRPLADAQVEQKAKEVVEDLYDQVKDDSLDATGKKRASKFAIATDRPTGIANMMKMARSDVGLMHMAVEMATNPLHLPVANGTVDLTTGSLLDISRHDLVTARSAIPYDATLPRPMWEAFVSWAMCGDPERVAFLKRLAGYSITGLFDEHVFPVLLGPGGNGKNTFIETLVEVLGDLAVFPFPGDAITGRDDQEHREKRSALLYGKRLAVVSETNRRASINGAALKSFTGDGQLMGRRLYADPFLFKSSHTLWFMSNHRPEINDDSDGMWRRVLLLPFEATLTDAQKIPRYHERMLRQEGPGIVAWLVEGAMEYLSDGLGIPADIRTLTEQYRVAEDWLGEFISSQLVVGADQFISRADLKASYQFWCADSEIDARDRAKPRELVDMICQRYPGQIDPNAKRPSGERGISGIGRKFQTTNDATMWR